MTSARQSLFSDEQAAIIAFCAVASSCVAFGALPFESRAFAADSPKIVWSHEIRHLDPAPATMAIVGSKAGDRFTPSYVDLPDSGKHGTAPFPLLTNIVPMLSPEVFGGEERVRISKADDGTLTVQCSAGRRPAGVVLSSAMFHYPRGLQGDLVVQGHSSGRVFVSLLDQGDDAQDAPAPAAGLPNDVLAVLPSSAWMQGNPAKQLVVSCTKEASVSLIRNIKLSPRRGRVLAQIGSWLWDISPWLDQPDRLVLLAKSHGVVDLFVQFQIEQGQIAEREKVLSFIEGLSAGGITVHAVEGDPQMASPGGREHALERAHVLRSLLSAAGGKLKSVQYDIEPYLLPQFDADPARGWDEWATSVNGLAHVLGARVSIAVPFWMLDQDGAQDALQKVKDSISAIVVMAYRTDAVELRRIAGKWLDWGSSQGIMIRIALETGALPVEYERTYILAESGTLLVERSGKTDRILMFDGNVPDSSNWVAYSFTKETEVSPGRISFMKNRPNLGKVLHRLREDLSGWESFGGMLVHQIMIP